MSNIAEYLHTYKNEIDAYLAKIFAREICPPQLAEALRYSTLGGKRVRAIMTMTIGRSLGGDDANIFPMAAAVEMIHAYSLVHDDLPAMDNDDYRRGQPTTHKKFSEAMAILCGDALLTHAFWLIAAEVRDKEIVAPLVQTLGWGAGIGGMVAGQVADILNQQGTPESEIMAAQNTSSPAQLLEFIHYHKTAALILAACQGGAIAAKASQKQLEQIGIYGKNTGMAFQIMDDILDVIGDKQKMGKAVQKDLEHGKVTYPGIWGVTESRQRATQSIVQACQAIHGLPGEQRMAELANFIITRDY